MKKKTLALAAVFCSPVVLALASAMVPKVLGILLALLQLGSNIGFGTLMDAFITLAFGVATDFLFLL